jgi:hypothetical protein
MKNPTRSKIYLAIAAMIVTTPLAVPAAAQDQLSLTQASALAFDFTTIDVPGASATLPRGIDPEGDIVGFYGVGAAFRGFLLHQGIVTDIEVPGASATRPRSINPQGDIVGFYVAGGVTHGFRMGQIRVRRSRLASTRLGASLMGSCLTRKAASQVLTSLGPHPPRPKVSILGVT